MLEKKDGTIRFCIDYRKLNDVTVKDSYPIPRIDTTLDALSGAKWFSTIDLKSGYWQVDMSPADKTKTAFSIPGGGHWQFTKMPFGLCNAGATLERLMEKVLSNLSWKVCLVYLDDIIIMSKTFDEHVENLRQVFERLRQANLKMNPKKCVLLQKEVSFLGHIVSENGVATDPSKIDTIKNWPIPKNVKEVRSFLGLCSYYRKFIYKFSDIAKPLHKLTELNRKFVWDADCNAAFDKLRRALISTPILAYPEEEGLFTLDTDASNNGLGAVLSQDQNGVEKVISYYSKAFSSAERNYCVTRRELLAIVSSIRHFHHYLYGRSFRVRTDHGSLKWLLNFKNPEGQIARWFESLSSYDFKIEHRAGHSHNNADALSRRPCFQEGSDCTHCSKIENKFKPLQIGEKQNNNCAEGKNDDKSMAPCTSPDSHKVCKVKTRSKRESSPDNTRNTNSPSSEKGNSSSPNNDHGEKVESKIKILQDNDSDIQEVIKWIKSNRKPKWEDISHTSETCKYYWARLASLSYSNEILYHKWENVVPKFQVILPRSSSEEVFENIHCNITGGHLGYKKTLFKAREKYFWHRMSQDIKFLCKKCDKCAARKSPSKSPKAPLQRYIVGSPMERWAVDILGPLPTTHKKNSYLMVVGDYFTKWTDAIPIRNKKAITIAQKLIVHVISIFGVPIQIHSDQGQTFESDVFKEICKILGIDKTRTTPYRPQSDGMIERANRTI